MAALPCVSKGNPKHTTPTTIQSAALTYIGTVEKPVFDAIRLATRPPNRSRVAAVPVPVPRWGPGNDSGVNAYL